MSEEVYVRLREFLDKLPGGYPETDSGVEIRILKKLFSPEDAELTMKPPMSSRRGSCPRAEVEGKMMSKINRSAATLIMSPPMKYTLFDSTN